MDEGRVRGVENRGAVLADFSGDKQRRPGVRHARHFELAQWLSAGRHLLTLTGLAFA